MGGLNQVMAGELRHRGRVQGSFQLTGLGVCLGRGVEGGSIKRGSQVSDEAGGQWGCVTERSRSAAEG